MHRRPAADDDNGTQTTVPSSGAPAWFARALRNPRFALTVVAILGLGIGINVATLGLLYRYYVSPLPYPQGGRIAAVFFVAGKTSTGETISVPTYEYLRKNVSALADAGLYRTAGYNLVRKGHAQRLEGAEATASVFTTLGVRPILGRVFGPQSDRPGGKPVAVLSYRLWQQLFAGRRSALGRSLKLNGRLYTVIGVMPKAFDFPTAQAELWTPRVIQAYELKPDMLTSFFDQMIVRLKPGHSVGELVTQVNAAFKNEVPASEWPALAKYGLHPTAQSWRESRVGDFAQSLTLVQFATALLLLLVWFNLANLVLARTFARRGELTLRRILGADTRSLAGAMLREHFALSLVGAGLGVALGRFLLGLFGASGVAAGASSIPGTSWPVLVLIAFGLAVLSAGIFTLSGVTLLRGRNLAGALGESGARTSQGPLAARIRKTLLVSQIALACALTGVGLLLGRGLLNLGAVQLGFKPAHVATFKLDFPRGQYSLTQMSNKLQSFRTAIGRLPGITAASVTSDVPFDGSVLGSAVFPRPANPQIHPIAFTFVTDSGYLKAIGLTLLAGRNFESTDATSGTSVAILDTLVAKQLFHTTRVVGREFSFQSPHTNRPGLLFRIIGVVPAARQVHVGAPQAQGSVYLDRDQVMPLQPMWWGKRSWYVAVRSPLPAAAVMSEIRRAAHDELPGIPLYDVQTMNQHLAGALAPNRLLTLLVGLFAFGALLLAAIGLYAVQSYAVVQRIREFAIRSALGAERGRLVGLVLAEAGVLLVLGLAIGLAGLAGVGLAFSSAFYGVPAVDPVSMALVVVVLAFAAALAGLGPAWRAGRVAPNEALRN